jgi:hypothetical protein
MDSNKYSFRGFKPRKLNSIDPSWNEKNLIRLDGKGTPMVMYSTVFTFQRGYFQVGSLGDLFCTNNPEGEFIVEVIDNATHSQHWKDVIILNSRTC